MPAGRLPHRPDRAGRPGAHHPRPLRPRARRPRRGARHGRDAEDHGGALRRGLRRHDAGGDARRDHDDRRHAGDLPSGRPRARLGADRGRGERLSASSPPATTSAAPTRPACRSCRCPATSSSPRRRSACRSSAIRNRQPRSRSSSRRSRSFPSARISSARIRSARRSGSSACFATPDTTAPIYLHGSMEKLCRLYEAEGIALGPLAPATVCIGQRRATSPARSSSARRRRSPSAGRAASPIRSPASPRAGCASAQRAKQSGVELPLILSDHADWDELTATIAEIAPSEVWVTHGREEALVRWCALNGIPAKPLHMVGYEENEGE